MIVFHEGLPRSGKSYDAVRSHIVPALKAGRKVWARLNGLDHAAIAKYIGKSEEDVRALLHLVGPDGDDAGEAEQRREAVHGLADVVEHGALVVIDECHEFYVSSRQPLPEAQERFFAMHGHYGLDIVLISQFYKRLHSAVRGRVEVKNLYRKMTAVGFKNHYVVQFNAAVAPDKFERTGSERHKYDPAIFGLYRSHAPGVTNKSVYEQGQKKVWEGSVGYLAIGMLVAVVLGVWALVGFFGGDGTAFVKGDKQDKAASPPVKLEPFQRPARAAVQPGIAPVTARPAPVVPDEPDVSPEAAYILDLNAQARPRLAGWIQAEGKTRLGLVEWVGASGVVIERLTLAQLRSLGWVVNIRDFGLILKREGQTVIVTAWPRDYGTRYTEQDYRRMDEALARSPSVSEPTGPPPTSARPAPSGPVSQSARFQAYVNR